MKVRFDKKWFNPSYFILNDILKNHGVRTVFFYGGKSSSKTQSICQIFQKEAALHGKSSLAYRKYSAHIPTTLKESFILATKTTRLYPAIKNQDRRFVCDNGAKIVMRGIDSDEKAKGVEGFQYVLLDELNQFEESEYAQFNMSLRGSAGQKIFATWNPVDENSWVKKMVDSYEWKESQYRLPSENSFVKISACGKVVLIKTDYYDNFWISGSKGKRYVVAGAEHEATEEYGFIDENLISEYDKLRTTNFNRYKVNVLGEWGKTTYGGEFLKCWKSEVHVGEFKYNPDLAIYLSFDENVNPYFPCGFFQIANDQKSAYMIHHIAAKNPNNTVNWMCAEIARKLREWKHDGKVYIQGDSTSIKDDVKMEKGYDLYRMIIDRLIDFKPQRRVTTNPSVKDSAEFFNDILDHNAEGVSFHVDKSCITAILDFENTKEDKNGKIDKSVVRDPITKVSYQPYGHFVDLTRYFLATSFAKEFSQHKGKRSTRVTTGKNVFSQSF